MHTTSTTSGPPIFMLQVCYDPKMHLWDREFEPLFSFTPGIGALKDGRAKHALGRKSINQAP